MLNPIPSLIDSQNFMPRNTAVANRHSSTPTFSITLPLTDTPLFMDIDMIDSLHSEEEEFHGKTFSHDPQLPSGPKETRRIPFRSPKSLPSMRTPPSSLFQLSQPERLASNSPTDELPPSFAQSSSSLSLHAIRRPIPVRMPLNVVALPPIGYERRQRDGSFNNEVGKGSGSLAKPIPIPAPSPPALTTKRSLLPGHGAAAGLPMFLYVLDANKRRNPHAPSLISKFNPLREYVPPCAWANRNFPLTSARFRTPLSLLPLRCRSDCDWATHEHRKSKENYLKRTILHCRGCRRDTLGKKLLVMNYLIRHLHHVLYSPPVPMRPLDDDDDPGAMEIDDDLLDSPLLRDFDDFDDFDDSTDGHDALLPGAPGIGISHLSLF